MKFLTRCGRADAELLSAKRESATEELNRVRAIVHKVVERLMREYAVKQGENGKKTDGRRS